MAFVSCVSEYGGPNALSWKIDGRIIHTSAASAYCNICPPPSVRRIKLGLHRADGSWCWLSSIEQTEKVPQMAIWFYSQGREYFVEWRERLQDGALKQTSSNLLGCSPPAMPFWGRDRCEVRGRRGNQPPIHDHLARKLPTSRISFQIWLISSNS